MARCLPGTGVRGRPRTDRTLRGSFAGPRHDFAARIGAAAPGGVATASNEAVADGVVSLSDFSVVLWLLGDEGTSDVTFTAAERDLGYVPRVGTDEGLERLRSHLADAEASP